MSKLNLICVCICVILPAILSQNNEEAETAKLAKEMKLANEKELLAAHKDLQKRLRMMERDVSTGIPGLLRGIKSGKPVEITVGLLQLVAAGSTIGGQLYIAVAAKLLATVISTIHEYREKEGEDPIMKALGSYKLESATDQVKSKQIFNVEEIYYILKKKKMDENTWSELKTHLKNLKEARIVFGQEVGTICGKDKSESTTKNCLKALKVVTVTSGYLSAGLIELQEVINGSNLKNKDENLKELKENYIDELSNRDREIFKFLLDPTSLNDYYDIFFQIFQTPGRHEEIREYIVCLDKTREGDQSNNDFRKVVACTNEKMQGPCRVVTQNTNKAKDYRTRSIFIPYTQTVTRITKNDKTNDITDLPGMAIYSSQRRFGSVNTIEFKDITEDKRASAGMICTTGGCCDRLDMGRSSRDKLKCLGEDATKLGVASYIDSIWVPRTYVAVLNQGPQSVKLIGPHLSESLKICKRRWDFITLLGGITMDSDDIIKYCTEENGGGLCLQALGSFLDFDKFQVRPQTLLRKISSSFSRKICDISVKSFVVPKGIEGNVCYKKGETPLKPGNTKKADYPGDFSLRSRKVGDKTVDIDC